MRVSAAKRDSPLSCATEAGDRADEHVSKRVRWLVEPEDEIASASASLLTMLADAPRARPAPDADARPWDAIKLGPLQYVYKRTLGDRQVFFKWFEPARSWSRRRGWRPWPTAAAAHLRWKRRVESLGVRTAPVEAAGEIIPRPASPRHPGSFVISSSPMRVRDLRSWASEPSAPTEMRAELAEQLRRCVRRLHEDGVGRLDFRPVNLLVDPETRDLILFDFDSFAPLPRFRRSKRIEEDMKKVRRTERFLLSGDLTVLG